VISYIKIYNGLSDAIFLLSDLLSIFKFSFVEVCLHGNIYSFTILFIAVEALTKFFCFFATFFLIEFAPTKINFHMIVALQQHFVARTHVLRTLTVG